MKDITDYTPIELVLAQLNDKTSSRDWAYEIACTSQYLMFETAYLWSVTGQPPYLQAAEFGLTDADIVSYQQQWKNAGINPLEVNYP